MSVSITYQAQRPDKLTANEQSEIETLISSMSVDDKIEAYLAGATPDGQGGGLNWESFTVYEPEAESSVVFEGSTKLPDNTDDALWIGVQHWCELLTQIRRVINDAQWHVAVHDHPITWDGTNQRFDPHN